MRKSHQDHADNAIDTLKHQAYIREKTNGDLPVTANQFQNTLILCFMSGFALMEFVTRRYQRTVTANANDTKLDLLMFLSLVAITQPLALMASAQLGAWLAPTWQNRLADLPWWAMVGLLLVGDDMTQYWWHRLSHSPLMWPLHRAHHSASYMSIRITYRNNFFYYLMMPGLWIGGALLYLGVGGMVYAVYMVVKLLVILGAHCAWRWDEPLYRIRALHPLAWVLERTISTPATHWAHHAITNEDGIGHYKGNFGNLLFFPVLQSQRAHSALRLGGKAYEENDHVASKQA